MKTSAKSHSIIYFSNAAATACLIAGLAGVAAPACAATAVAAERSLAGVPILSSMSFVLHKFGTPDAVRIGNASTAAAQPASSGQPGGSYAYGGIPGRFESSSPALTTITWMYDQPDAGVLTFTFSADGRVVQIHLTGLRSTAHTARGISLGAKMSDVMNRYGYPERQSIDGKILSINYVERSHAAFQFYSGKLVGIVIATVE